jgi:hypothetical protein
MAIEKNLNRIETDHLAAEAANTAANAQEGTVEVLYQKMGDRWFAFSLVGEEVFVGSITQDEIDSLESQGKLTPKRMPEA